MEVRPALLEYWLRDYYFSTDIDIGSSGVQNFSLAEVRQLTGLPLEELDRAMFDDTPTTGSAPLREAIARRWDNGDPDRVMVAHGSTEVILLVMLTALSRDDEVVVLDPCYHSLCYLAETIGCRLRPWPLREENQFVPQMEDLRQVMSAKTRMVVVNFPHNPTGVTLTLEQHAELIEIVAESGAYLVWDGAFSELTHGSEPLPDPGQSYHRTISIGTLSKAYGLAGLRIGWCLTEPQLIDEMMGWRDYTTLYVSKLIEIIAQRAIEQGDRLRDLRLRQARTNLEILERWAELHGEVLEWSRPQGGVTVFPRLPRIADVDAFCHDLARVCDIQVVPGSSFKHPQHVRIGFGGSTASLEKGLARLSRPLRLGRVEE